MEYYQRLRGLREDNDLKQEDIRNYLYLGKNTYSNYENGKREFPFLLVAKLAQKYGVSLDYIAGFTEDKGGLHQNEPEEQELLNNFKRLTTLNKGKILGKIEEMIEQQIEEQVKTKETA